MTIDATKWGSKLDEKLFAVVNATLYYDGPLAGIGTYDGNKCFFSISDIDQAALEGVLDYKYALYAISDEQYEYFINEQLRGDVWSAQARMSKNYAIENPFIVDENETVIMAAIIAQQPMGWIQW